MVPVWSAPQSVCLRLFLHCCCIAADVWMSRMDSIFVRERKWESESSTTDTNDKRSSCSSAYLWTTSKILHKKLAKSLCLIGEAVLKTKMREWVYFWMFSQRPVFISSKPPPQGLLHNGSVIRVLHTGSWSNVLFEQQAPSGFVTLDLSLNSWIGFVHSLWSFDGPSRSLLSSVITFKSSNKNP